MSLPYIIYPYFTTKTLNTGHWILLLGGGEGQVDRLQDRSWHNSRAANIILPEVTMMSGSWCRQ